jgi:hypothetical protein
VHSSARTDSRRSRVSRCGGGGHGEHGLAGAGWWARERPRQRAPVPDLLRVGTSALLTARPPASSAARAQDRRVPRVRPDWQ